MNYKYLTGIIFAPVILANMKGLFILVALLVAVYGESDEELWRQFKAEHGKTYKSLIEERLRFSIFQSSLRQIEEHNIKYNNGEVSYFLKVTHFADLTDKEFTNTYMTFIQSSVSTDGLYEPANDAKPPESIDWRKKGAVLEVGNQGKCGSCWAFAIIGTVEGQNAILYNKTVPLSAQQFVDCAWLGGGCKGADILIVMSSMSSKTLFTEKSYPYTGTEGKCYKGVNAGIRIKKYYDIIPEEQNLKNIVGTRGPVLVGIHGDDIKLYGGGIFNKPDCGKVLDHAVLAVGYGSKDGQDYWIIKNSWGKAWGDAGYIYMSRNKSKQCGLGQFNVLAEVKI